VGDGRIRPSKPSEARQRIAEKLDLEFNFAGRSDSPPQYCLAFIDGVSR